RVRLLATGNTSKNDPNDARSVAVAALRSAGVGEVCRDDHAAVLKVWSKRYKDLGRARTQVACRLHQVLCELIPGGVSKEITAGKAARILASFTPVDAVAVTRCELAAELTEDLRGIDVRLRDTRKKLAAAVAAARTSLTGLFGIGPVSAAAIIGDVRHVSRFPGRDQLASHNGTAPIEVSSGGRRIYRLSPRPPALRASHSRASHTPYAPGCRPRLRFLSRFAAISREPAAGSRTGQSPAAQRRLRASLTRPPASRQCLRREGSLDPATK